jgi:hypothetical protein
VDDPPRRNPFALDFDRCRHDFLVAEASPQLVNMIDPIEQRDNGIYLKVLRDAV